MSDEDQALTGLDSVADESDDLDMIGWGLALASLLMATTASGTPPPTPPMEPHYDCGIEPRHVAGGVVTLGAYLELDGTVGVFAANWRLDQRAPPQMTIEIEWRGDDFDAMIASAQVSLQLRSNEMLDGPVELISRGAAAGAPALYSDLAGASSRSLYIKIHWAAFDAAIRSARGVILAARSRNRLRPGRQERVRPATFDAASAVLARARPEIEAMIADYRNRCHRDGG